LDEILTPTSKEFEEKLKTLDEIKIPQDARKVKRSDIKDIIAAHAVWLESVVNTQTTIKGQRAFFHEADLNGFDFSGLDLRGIVFSEAILIGANLSKCDLSFANFENANLTGANFQNSKLNHTKFKGAILIDTGIDIKKGF